MPEPATVLLDSDEVDIVVGGVSQRLPCTVVLETDPRPRLAFRVTGLDPLIVWTSPPRFSIHIIKADVKCDVFVTSSDGGTVVLSPEREPIAVGQSGSLRELRFDMINFPSFWALASPSTRLPADQLDIAVGGWQVEIRPPRKSPDVEALRSTLYSVTHSCAIRKNDNATFSSGEALELLNVFHDAMTFAAGLWVAPVFVCGFGSDQQIAWKEWGTRPLHPDIGGADTWFDTHHGETLIGILPGLWELRKESERTQTFHSALYWYVRSTPTRAGVDGGIVLLQAALELLSWQLFVGDRKALSHEGFRKLPDDDHLRLLIESCGIPIGIPQERSRGQSQGTELERWAEGARRRPQSSCPSKQAEATSVLRRVEASQMVHGACSP